AANGSKPIEIVAREGKLPSLRIFRSELETIVAKMRDLVGGPNDVVVAATIDGRQIKRFARDFFVSADLPQYVTAINLSINDGRQPFMSVLVINLSELESTFFVQSENALWVSGSYSELEALFRRYSTPLGSLFQKHGTNANPLLVLFALAFLPETHLLARFVILVGLVGLAMLIMRVHHGLTSTRVYLDPALTRGFFSKVWPSLLSALSAAAILGGLTWAYNVFPGVALWFAK
ncbi:hypothetical protein, partial [Pseudorhodoplanes sp.]|uniref:hypothetical protein n=1 Tax=Pseudorhodoplanes sp. TaxID=1934341 RepID=UPI002B7A5809